MPSCMQTHIIYGALPYTQDSQSPWTQILLIYSSFSRLPAHVYMYVCVCVCIHAYMQVCISLSVSVYVCTYVRVYGYMYVCIYVCMYVYMYVCTYTCTYVRQHKLQCMSLCTNTCECAYKYLVKKAYVYTHTYIVHTHT